jgi:hypothetical protein
MIYERVFANVSLSFLKPSSIVQRNWGGKLRQKVGNISI